MKTLPFPASGGVPPRSFGICRPPSSRACACACACALCVSRLFLLGPCKDAAAQVRVAARRSACAFGAALRVLPSVASLRLWAGSPEASDRQGRSQGRLARASLGRPAHSLLGPVTSDLGAGLRGRQWGGGLQGRGRGTCEGPAGTPVPWGRVELSGFTPALRRGPPQITLSTWSGSFRPLAARGLGCRAGCFAAPFGLGDPWESSGGLGGCRPGLGRPG